MMPDEVEDVEKKLAHYLSDGGWELYDGVKTVQDCELTVSDIVLSVTLNSRLNTRRQVWQVWKGRLAVEKALTRIPANASLEDEVIPWEELRNLFQAMCAIEDIAGAKATKILHKKRPNLIPIFDSILEEFYKNRIPRWSSLSWADGLVEYMKVFRADLLANRNGLHVLCDMMAARGWPITPVRAMEVLIWIETEPNGEYR